MSLSVDSAAAVVRPPEEGLDVLRRPLAQVVAPGSVACADGGIAALDADDGAQVRLDARGMTLVPGFVDCHTHLPFAGWRAEEYAQKVAGVPYADVARAGGGIAASARALREAPDEAVLAQAAALARELLAHGTTTFEGKSGYGLSQEGELRTLRLGRALGERVAQQVLMTALLAHAVPPGTSADAWMADVVPGLAAAVARDGLAVALDVFVEAVAFTNAHLERMGELAAAHGLALRAHVEQFATHRSVPVALAAGARSVDHLSCLHPDDLPALAAADCAAVLLPSAELLGDERTAPGRALADAGAIVVLATDLNPGTSPVASLPLVVGLAVRRYRLTALEALAAITLNAAWVLGLHRETGSIEVGKRADLVLLDGPLEHVPYRLGHCPVAAVVAAGDLVWVREDARDRVRGAW